MLLRPTLIAFVVLGAAAMAAAEPANRSSSSSSTEVRAPATAASPLTTTSPRRPPVVVGPTVLEAENSFKCEADGTIYTLSVDGGRCTPDVVTLANGERITRGMTCQNAGGSTATASCTAGCGQTTGSGSCTIR